MTCVELRQSSSKDLRSVREGFVLLLGDSSFPTLLRVMATEGVKPETHTQLTPVNAVKSSCRKKKSETASFIEDVRDHIDEFIHASMDEHKTCFKKTIEKMFGMSKVVAERNAEAKEVESVLPLQTTISK
ncbi:unnamed protein product [Cuscuta epithymum]|uniref:Uncharacterized protein n=1 Tax=Cuscuta epithymum TaxID=186058 RepID=A0AAV0FMA2_9ASTE|nr:unnamed protein product [Cuscuta epithymum]